MRKRECVISNTFSVPTVVNAFVYIVLDNLKACCTAFSGQHSGT
jgi:hypothetical protein